jgi:pyruvate dehydrogenase E1 component
VGLAEGPRRVSMSDLDPLETRKWLDALNSVVVFDGADRTTFLLDELLNGARRNGVPVPYSANTPYLNTIPPVRETPHPGDQEIEYKIRSLIRWKSDPVGGLHRS